MQSTTRIQPLSLLPLLQQSHRDVVTLMQQNAHACHKNKPQAALLYSSYITLTTSTFWGKPRSTPPDNLTLTCANIPQHNPTDTSRNTPPLLANPTGGAHCHHPAAATAVTKTQHNAPPCIMHCVSRRPAMDSQTICQKPDYSCAKGPYTATLSFTQGLTSTSRYVHALWCQTIEPNTCQYRSK